MRGGEEEYGRGDEGVMRRYGEGKRVSYHDLYFSLHKAWFVIFSNHFIHC